MVLSRGCCFSIESASPLFDTTASLKTNDPKELSDHGREVIPRSRHSNQDFHFVPNTATVYPRAAPNTTSFHAEPCTSPPPVGARARPSAHRRRLSGLNGAPADNAPCETFLEPKLLILTRATLPTRHRQRPDPSQHVAEQPPVQIPLGQQQPVIPRVLDQPTAGLHQPVL